jgi:aminoglycoside phosphotransferase (APT) family kinase protein
MPSAAFDLSALDRWLKAHVPGLRGFAQLTPIEGGQSNPTFFLNYDDCVLVLRKQPSGDLLPSAHAIDREYRIMSALAVTHVPVPRMRVYCADRAIIGTPFYVMDKLDGRVLPNYALTEIAPAARALYFTELARTMARLHAVDWRGIGLSDFGKPGNYFSRQIGRWTRQWQSSKTGENAAIERLTAWLPNNIPSDDTTAIAHGDFRMGNMMWHPTEARIIGVLDWELSTLGHPLADLAYSCMAWHLAPDEFEGILGLDWQMQQIPTQAEFIAAYNAESSVKRHPDPFHLVFSMFRFAVILEGVAARAQLGNASSANAANVGAQASAIARRAEQLID